MLLVMDVGNTITMIGLYEGPTLRAHWRSITGNYRTSDELRVFLTSLLQAEGLEPRAINGCCISSVVPPLNAALADLCTNIGILERGEMIYQGSVAEALRRARVGSVLHVITPDEQEKTRQMLATLKGVESAQLRDGMVVVNLDRDTNDFSFIAKAMIQNDLRISEIKQEEVNLETAFMRLTKGIVQ